MTSIAALFLATSAQFHLPSGLLSSLCFIETNHEISLINNNDGGSDSYGICQIKLETAQWMGFKGTKEQLMEPRINIYYAGKYLARNIKRYDGHVEKAVIAYNQGHAGKALRTNYSTKVFNQWRIAHNGI